MSDPDVRQRLVDRLKRSGVLRDERVAQALLRVPRERFIPTVSLEDAYDDRALPVKEHGGEVLSSISQPTMIVQMLQMLDVRPGQSVLEIGTGTGYHAALLAELTGREGQVLTVDIEADLIESASARLRALGYTQVRVEHTSALATTDTAFDRIVATARADDIDPDWWRLLRDEGRLVVPLQLGYGGERAVAFVRHATLLHSVASRPCAFIGMRGGSDGEGDIFFPSQRARYADSRNATLDVVAVRPGDANAELFQNADVIVARPQTLFAIRLL